MRNVCLQIRKMDSSIYQYNMLLKSEPDNMNTSTYVRSIVVAQAGPGVTWRDILAEFKAKRDKPDEGLVTATFVHHKYLMIFTVQAFLNCSILRPRILEDNRTDEEMFEETAKELIAQRDYEEAGGAYKMPHISARRDFWPKY